MESCAHLLACLISPQYSCWDYSTDKRHLQHGLGGEAQAFWIFLNAVTRHALLKLLHKDFTQGSPFEQARNTPIQREFMVTTDVTASRLTTITETLEETIAQPATTFVTTHTQAVTVTDYGQYGSLVASDVAAASKSSTTKDIPSSTGTDADAPQSASSQPPHALAPSKLPLTLSIVLGVISLLFIGSLIGWYLLWRRKKHRKSATAPALTASREEISELAGTAHMTQKIGSTTRISASPVEIDSVEKSTRTRQGQASTKQTRKLQRTGQPAGPSVSPSAHGRAELQA